MTSLWLTVTTRNEEKIHLNFEQVIVIYPIDETKHTRLLTPAGEIVIKEHLAYIQSKIAI